MSNKPKAGAVVFAKEVCKVAKFYEQMLSMSVIQTASEKIIIESEELLLVIHGIPKSIADTFIITDPPELRVDMPIKLFFPVSSLSDARAKAPALGGKVNPASTEWETGTFRACDGFDPEGNVIQFRENKP
jgi:predicted enzyme related to lactoylglutathione lyase